MAWLPPLPLRISVCGDTQWFYLELHLGSGRPTVSGCWPFCLLFSVAVSLLFCFFSFFSPVDSALQLERLVRLPLGKYFIRPGEISQVTGNPCFGGWPSPARASFLPVFLEIRKPGLCKILRVLAFAYPYTWDSLPIFSRLFLFPGESAQNEATMYHQKHMAMTLLASFFYSAHLPERLAPGRFDYIGHSHQLFHVCVILATHMQMEAILLDKSLRKEWLLANCKPLLFPQIAGAILLCLIFSLSNIIYFSAALYRIPEPELHKKET
uniref:Progestin and adipoQ receptor family member 5 n=1 Tax=Sus scrofa TaxID=9823 RepID=A0A8D1HM43_PIG